MNSVLIAEDELLIRTGLESFIPWKELNLRVVATAADGMEAYEAFLRYRPDIIITDIRMPRMDGIEFIKKLRLIDKKCRIIVITCIEYFGELYKSMREDISGYLLKATMTHEELYSMLKRISSELDKNDDHESADGGLADFLSSDVSSVPNLLLPSEQMLTYLGVWYDARSEAFARSLTRMLTERFSVLSSPVTGKYMSHIRLLFPRYIPPDALKAVFDGIYDYIEEIFGMKVRAAGAYTENLAETARKIQMCDAISSRPYFYSEVFYMENYSQVPENNILDSIAADIACRGYQSTEPIFSDLLTRVISSFNETRSLFCAAMTHLAERMAYLTCDTSARKKLSCISFEKYENALGALSALRNAVHAYECNTHYAGDILKTIQYIVDNCNETISLSSLASNIALSPNYYAILFKESTGMNFSDFITGVRLNKARDLLVTTEKSISVISTECGFSDPAYFTRCFKTEFGETPRKWRKK